MIFATAVRSFTPIPLAPRSIELRHVTGASSVQVLNPISASHCYWRDSCVLVYATDSSLTETSWYPPKHVTGIPLDCVWLDFGPAADRSMRLTPRLRGNRKGEWRLPRLEKFGLEKTRRACVGPDGDVEDATAKQVQKKQESRVCCTHDAFYAPRATTL